MHETMPTKNTSIAALGLAFVVIGAFLPWSVAGDFVSIWRPGLAVVPAFKDYGGLLVIVIATTTAASLLLNPRPTRSGAALPLALSLLLLLVALAYVVEVFQARASESLIIGRTTLQLGLPLVILGAILLLVAARSNARTSAA